MPVRSDPTLPGWEAPATSRAGERLGAWEITGLLGAGSTGEVYEVRRVDGQVEGYAALKLLERGTDGAAVLYRFARERQALARLNHPHIARLFDVGLSADGLPYVVMERVDGRPIDQAVHGLPLEGRLALFLQLADAVAHAHRQLLVHRDLKPGNVLVGDTPGGAHRQALPGQVKLLDFGIAQALDPLDDTGSTPIGQLRASTSPYASPEQVRGEPVGTATDIYSLGVLLYELLTGVRPTGRGATTPEAAARSVVEETPVRPSQLAASVSNDPRWPRLRRRLRGDLDHIVMKALEKSPERRYPSVDAMVLDLRACQSGHPVSARAPRAGYLLRKFVARHRLAVLGGVLGVAGLAAGLGVSVWQAQLAAQARDVARLQAVELKRMSTELVYRFGDALTRLPGGAAAQEAALTQTLAALEPVLRAAPDDADMQALVASALGRLAEIQGAERQAAPARAAQAQATVVRALALGDAVWPARRGDWRFASWHVRTLGVQAQLQRSAGQTDAALAALAKAAARCEEALASTPPPEAEGRARLIAERGALHLATARIRLDSQQATLALDQFAQAEADHRRLLGDAALLQQLARNATPGAVSAQDSFTHQLAATLAGSALAHGQLDQLSEMRRDAEGALALHRELLLQEPATLAWRDGLATDSHTLAIALLRLDEPEAALAAAQTAWDSLQRLANDGGPASPWPALLPSRAPVYGQALAAVDRHEGALAIYDLALAGWSAELAQRNDPALRLRLTALQVLRARSLAAVGQVDTAGPLMSTAIAALRGLASPTGTLDGGLRRQAQLALADALSTWAEWLPAEAGATRAEAVNALKTAAALQRLGADHEKLLARLAGPPA